MAHVWPKLPFLNLSLPPLLSGGLQNINVPVHCSDEEHMSRLVMTDRPPPHRPADHLWPSEVNCAALLPRLPRQGHRVADRSIRHGQLPEHRLPAPTLIQSSPALSSQRPACYWSTSCHGDKARWNRILFCQWRTETIVFTLHLCHILP